MFGDIHYTNTFKKYKRISEYLTLEDAFNYCKANLNPFSKPQNNNYGYFIKAELQDKASIKECLKMSKEIPDAELYAYEIEAKEETWIKGDMEEIENGFLLAYLYDQKTCERVCKYKTFHDFIAHHKDSTTNNEAIKSLATEIATTCELLESFYNYYYKCVKNNYQYYTSPYGE